MIDFQILADELTNDPLARGYSGMNDVEASQDLNTTYRNLWIELSSSEIYEAIISSEFQLLSPAEEVRIDRILGLGDGIQTTPGSQARSEIITIFGLTSSTVATLIAIAQQSQSRSHELVWGKDPATTADVQFARTL